MCELGGGRGCVYEYILNDNILQFHIPFIVQSPIVCVK